MSFEKARRQSAGFFNLVLIRLLSKQGSSRTAMTSSTCDVEVAYSRISRKTARILNSISALVWCSAGMVGRVGGVAVIRGLASLWSVS